MTTVVIVALVAFVAGGATGIGVTASARNKAVAALEAQAQSLDAVLDGQTEILTAAQKPVVLDAELKATLAETPPTCIREMGGDPMSSQCLLTLCWAHGTSSAQRPSCSAVEALTTQALTPTGN
jgi:hypothetical protein